MLTVDFAAARNNMVDGQIRPNRVSDPRVLDAMRRLPREQFLPPEMSGVAYRDEDIPLGRGRYLVEPLVVARLVQLARLRPGARALVIAAGMGYGAAVAAACGAAVVALEEDEALMSIALRVLTRVAPAVRLVDGPLMAGLPAEAPFDAIIIEGAVTAIPAALAGQLAAAGRLATVVAPANGIGGRMVLAERIGLAAGAKPQLRTRDMFDCSTPLVQSLCAPPGFVF